MRAVIVFVAAIVVALLVVVGVEMHSEAVEPEAGAITELEYDPAWVQTVCTSTGRVTTCTPIYHDECWRVEYADGDRHGDACIGEDTWQTLTVGTWFEKP